MGQKRVQRAAKSMATVSGGLSIFGFNFGGGSKPKIDKNQISGPTNAHGVGGYGNVNPEFTMEHGSKLDGHWAFADLPKAGK